MNHDPMMKTGAEETRDFTSGAGFALALVAPVWTVAIAAALFLTDRI